MKRIAFLTLAVLFTVILFSSTSNAQTVNTNNGKGTRVNWIDANGDGICDNFGTPNQGSNQVGKGYGKKDGTGNPARPQDGTGYGKKGGYTTGTGVCDGTGPKGSARRGGK
ncbi:MAG: hypothetical protein AB1521_01620 [Bacteroidota bacterium]